MAKGLKGLFNLNALNGNFHGTVSETTAGEDAGPVFGKDAWVFGRSNECDFVYTAPKISRQHFIIERIEGHFYVSDLGSTNGTRLNGKPLLRKERLFVGDVISMGDVDIVFTKNLLH